MALAKRHWSFGRNHYTRRAILVIATLAAFVSVTGCTPKPTQETPKSPRPRPATVSTVSPSSGEQGQESETGVRIRLENLGDVMLGDVVVHFPEQTVKYGDVAPGGATAYHAVDKAYGYAWIEYVYEGERREMRPVDYVGESLLEPGAYTYVLDRGTGDSASYLDLKLRSE